MTVKVVLFGNLARLLPEGSTHNSALVTVEHGATVETLLDGLGVPPDSRGYVTVNGEHSVRDTVLNEADEVRVIVPLCGG